MPNVKLDIHNAVAPVDLSDINDLEEVVVTLQALVQRKIPVRFGFVPSVISPAAEKQAKAVYYLKENFGLEAAMAYLQEVSLNKSFVCCC